MNGWASIIEAVKSPLALAALCILVLSSIFIALLKVKRVGDKTLPARLARYTFVIALVGLIGGLGTYVFIQSLDTEIRVSGNVRDTDGDPVGDATVLIEGGPSTATHDDGSFEMTVARSRFRSGLNVVVSHPLYIAARQARTGDLGSPFSFTLKEPPKDYRVVQSIDFLAVGQWLGKTWIRAGIVLQNKNPASLNVTGIVAHVISQSGDISQVPLFIFDGAVPPITPNASVRLRTNRIQRLDTEFYEPLARPDLIEAINKAFMAHGMQVSSSDSDPLFSPSLTAQVQDLARKGLIWKTGSWKVEVCALLEADRDCKSWSFALTEQQVKAISGIIAHYPSGVGVLNAYRFSNNPDDRGFVEVATTPVP